MGRKKDELGYSHIEALIYRLFAEKQLAVALLALLMVVYLMSAQFLLLRLTPPLKQQATAPGSGDRMDAVCSSGALHTLDGHRLGSAEMRGHRLVVHLAGQANQCVVEATEAGVSEVVVGVSLDEDVAAAWEKGRNAAKWPMSSASSAGGK